MRILLSFFLGAACGLYVSGAEARDITYPGGFSVMTMNTGDMNAVYGFYSPTARYSLGYAGEYWRDGDYTIQSVRLNYLAKRWNNPDSQANLYLRSGVGIAYGEEGEDSDREVSPAAYVGGSIDWEDRRFYISYENRYTSAGDLDGGFMQSARVGVAPYVGEFGDLHTWLMLQADHEPEAGHPVTVTPLVRMFKGAHLVEAGVSNQGDVLFHWMIQF
jgi:hypothetical protein